MESERASETYTRAEIRRILGINENSLRSWERAGLAEARDDYSFADLISLKTLQSLRENRIPAKRIREAMQQLRTRLANVSRPLDELKIVSDGRRIAVELPGEKMEALTGQMLFNFEAEQLRSVSTLERRDREQPPVSNAESEEYWFQYALELERSGAPSHEIIEVYRKVLDYNPQAAGAWVNIGTLHYRQGLLHLAEQSYKEAIQAYPEYALAHYNLGNVYEESSRLEDAAKQYEAALRFRSDYADAHYNLALVHERLERFLDAARHWKRYLELDPTSPWANVARRKHERLLGFAGGDELNTGRVLPQAPHGRERIGGSGSARARVRYDRHHGTGPSRCRHADLRYFRHGPEPFGQSRSGLAGIPCHEDLGG